MKIIIADDHSLVRSGLAQLLQSDSKTYQIIEASNRKEILIHSNENISLLLLDLDMPGVGSITSVDEICSFMPSTAVVVISGNESTHIIKACMDIGVMGFIPKSSSNQTILSAVQLVLSGAKYIPYVLIDNDVRLPKEPKNITVRQKQVWKLLARGLSNKSIATELNISEGTVKQHTFSLYKKLKINNRFEAIQKAKEVWG